jgi:hypothetical protein
MGAVGCRLREEAGGGRGGGREGEGTGGRAGATHPSTSHAAPLRPVRHWHSPVDRLHVPRHEEFVAGSHGTSEPHTRLLASLGHGRLLQLLTSSPNHGSWHWHVPSAGLHVPWPSQSSNVHRLPAHNVARGGHSMLPSILRSHVGASERRCCSTATAAAPRQSHLFVGSTFTTPPSDGHTTSTFVVAAELVYRLTTMSIFSLQRNSKHELCRRWAIPLDATTKSPVSIDNPSNQHQHHGKRSTQTNDHTRTQKTNNKRVDCSS